MLFSTGSGSSPRNTTSETANRPPGLSTRCASFMTRCLSADRLMTQFEMMTSTVSEGSGMFGPDRMAVKCADSVPESFERGEDSEICAPLFAGESCRVAEVRWETTGRGRFRAFLEVEDVTGRSDAPDAEGWIDGRFRDGACAMSCPQRTAA